MKFKLLFVVLSLMLICGCSASKPTTLILKNISFSADITYLDSKYICEVDITEETNNFRVLSPDELSGLTFCFSKDGVCAEYLGISYTQDIENMPMGSVAVILSDIISDANSKDIFDASNKENYTLIGEYDDRKYEFVFSPSGLPLALTIPDADFSVRFDNVTIK